MLSANEIRGLYAILPTPAKPGAEHILAHDTVDLDETARTIEALIADGCDGLIALGTTGECATLSQEDYDSFVACLVETTRKRVPLFVGTSALGGYEVARRMRLVNDLGAEGTLLGLPMWQPVTVDAAVQYYRELSEGFPEVAIMVYANMRAFRFAFPDEFWHAVVKVAPTVVSAKYAQPRDLRKLIQITEGRVNIVPNEMTMARFYEESPETMDPAYLKLARQHRCATVFCDADDFPSFADLTADFVYARLMRSEARLTSGYAPKALDRWAEDLQTWAAGGEPADLPRLEAPAKASKPRDVFVFFINGAKERAPAAAMGLLQRLGFEPTNTV